MSVVAIIPARGGSKGIPRKNLLPLCGKPLIGWSIEQACAAESIDAVYVSSDSDEILEVARAFGAVPIERPDEISGDRASSESVWLHALDQIEAKTRVDIVVGMQATSPVRESSDLDEAVRRFQQEPLDSMLSCCEVEDFFMWKLDDAGLGVPTNHDYTQRRPRQQIEKRYLENGSFYLFRSPLFREVNNRLTGRIGFHVMARHKMYQIDNPDDVRLVEAILRGYGYCTTA
jgi:CMP-N,N'-diacetyllegionaminic acid synthase